MTGMNAYGVMMGVTVSVNNYSLMTSVNTHDVMMSVMACVNTHSVMMMMGVNTQCEDATSVVAEVHHGRCGGPALQHGPSLSA